jgi:hypothetical protein
LDRELCRGKGGVAGSEVVILRDTNAIVFQSDERIAVPNRRDTRFTAGDALFSSRWNAVFGSECPWLFDQESVGKPDDEGRSP